MDTLSATFTVTDLRKKTKKVMKAAEESGYVHIFHRSRAKVSLIDSAYLKVLQSAYEDYLDTLEFDRTVNLKRIPLEIHRRKLHK